MLMLVWPLIAVMVLAVGWVDLVARRAPAPVADTPPPGAPDERTGRGA
ncbi:hypothetical protein [Streptomyces longispororuber]